MSALLTGAQASQWLAALNHAQWQSLRSLNFTTRHPCYLKTYVTHIVPSMPFAEELAHVCHKYIRLLQGRKVSTCLARTAQAPCQPTVQASQNFWGERRRSAGSPESNTLHCFRLYCFCTQLRGKLTISPGKFATAVGACAPQVPSSVHCPRGSHHNWPAPSAYVHPAHP